MTLVLVTVTGLFGLLGTFVGAWLTQRSAVSARQQEEIATARVALVRLASLLVTDDSDGESTIQVAQEAATGSIALGHGSATALAMLEAVTTWRGFERGSFPRSRARDEMLPLLDEMLEKSLPPSLRYKGGPLGPPWQLQSAVRRPD